MPCLWVFGGGETCGGNGSCSRGHLICLWVKIDCLHGGLVVEIRFTRGRRLVVDLMVCGF